MFDDRRWIHAKERMPNRAIWEMLTIFGNGIGIILCFTIIGIPLGLPLILFGLFAAYRSFRYPVVKVTCPVCYSRLQVEKEVEQFHCMCYTHLKKEEGEWKKVE